MPSQSTPTSSRKPKSDMSPGFYQDRTLYTAWSLSYDRLENDDLDAAQTFSFFHYESVR